MFLYNVCNRCHFLTFGQSLYFTSNIFGLIHSFCFGSRVATSHLRAMKFAISLCYLLSYSIAVHSRHPYLNPFSSDNHTPIDNPVDDCDLLLPWAWISRLLRRTSLGSHDAAPHNDNAIYSALRSGRSSCTHIPHELIAACLLQTVCKSLVPLLQICQSRFYRD